MHIRYSGLLSILVCALCATPSANALVIKASNYAIGTNLTNAFPGVTLEWAYHSESDGPGVFETAPLVVTGSMAQNIPLNFNSLGTGTGGGGCFPIFDTSQNPQCVWSAVYVAITRPNDGVAFTTYTDTADLTYTANLDANGNPYNLSGETGTGCAVPGVTQGQTCPLFEQTFSGGSTGGTPLIIGSSSSAAYVIEIDIAGLVPEPGSIDLLAGGLLGIGISLFWRRRARQFTTKLPAAGDQ